MVKVVDFGLCRTLENEDTKIANTTPGAGTCWYLPPEHYSENPQVSSKIDIWSAGVIFYEMLYGKRPFGQGISQQAIIRQGVILNAGSVEFPSVHPKKLRVSEGAK